MVYAKKRQELLEGKKNVLAQPSSSIPSYGESSLLPRCHVLDSSIVDECKCFFFFFFWYFFFHLLTTPIFIFFAVKMAPKLSGRELRRHLKEVAKQAEVEGNSGRAAHVGALAMGTSNASHWKEKGKRVEYINSNLVPTPASPFVAQA